MYDTMAASDGPLDQQPWVRSARLLVGQLRDQHPKVDLDPVRQLMRETHIRIQRENEHLFERHPESGDVPTRLVISFARLVTASARGHNRGHATEQDVLECVVANCHASRAC